MQQRDRQPNEFLNKPLSSDRGTLGGSLLGRSGEEGRCGRRRWRRLGSSATGSRPGGRRFCPRWTVVPWAELCALIEPVYPQRGKGRRVVVLERMLRSYFLRQWANLSDPGAKEALYDSATMRRFAGIDLGRALFQAEHEHLDRLGLRLSTGTIVDATIIDAPSSTKSAAQSRDPERHQSKKGNQWHFGMKAHVGVDSWSKVIDAVVATAANVADATILSDLLHGDETRVWGDQAYRGDPRACPACARIHQPALPALRGRG